MKRIHLLPLSLRPREKLLKSGPEALNIEELLSVIFVTGTRRMPLSKLTPKVAHLAKHDFTKDDLLKINMGTSKTAQVLAARELGKRLLEQYTVTVVSPEQVFAHSLEIINQHKESLLCFYLNARGELLKKEIVAVGSLNKASLLPREIFSVIKELPVASIILAHNHPSGVLEPSEDDLRFTHRVKLAGDILGVELLDHLIVSKHGWVKIKF